MTTSLKSFLRVHWTIWYHSWWIMGGGAWGPLWAHGLRSMVVWSKWRSLQLVLHRLARGRHLSAGRAQCHNAQCYDCAVRHNGLFRFWCKSSWCVESTGARWTPGQDGHWGKNYGIIVVNGIIGVLYELESNVRVIVSFYYWFWTIMITRYLLALKTQIKYVC